MEFHVVYISDDNFASKLGISLLSMFEHNLNLQIVVHILDMGIDALNKKRLQRLCANYSAKCIWYEAVDIKIQLEKMKLHMPVENNSIATLGRLFLPEILPSDIDKVLYLDCDTIIEGSLKDLAKLKLDCALGVVKDVNYSFFKKRPELNGINDYFNAGVILINMEQYRLTMGMQNLKEYIKKDYLFADQDILNIIFKNNKKILSPVYNSVNRVRMVSPSCLLRWMGEDERELYSIKKLMEAHTSPIIIHYTSSVLGRPWEVNCIDPKVSTWRNVYSRSPWSEEKLTMKQLSKSNKIGRMLYRILPERMFCAIDYAFAKKKCSNL